jgi:hypothetical protein
VLEVRGWAVSWFYVDDRFHSHKKLAHLPERMLTACVGLWTLAGSWSRNELTGGSIPSGQVRRLGGTTKEADALVAAGLWVKTEDGYAFHDWAEWQETTEDVAERRKQTKERVRKLRASRSAGKSRNADVTPLHERYGCVSNAGVTQQYARGNAPVLGEGEGEGELHVERREVVPTGVGALCSDSPSSDILEETARLLVKGGAR